MTVTIYSTCIILFLQWNTKGEVRNNASPSQHLRSLHHFSTLSAHFIISSEVVRNFTITIVIANKSRFCSFIKKKLMGVNMYKIKKNFKYIKGTQNKGQRLVAGKVQHFLLSY